MPEVRKGWSPKTMYVGIDPGASGGLVRYGPSFLSDNPTSYHVRLQPMPKTEADVWDWIEQCFIDSSSEKWGLTAVIEQVSGYVGENQPGSSAFKFGMGYGGLRMALIAAGVPFETVTPQTWQKAFGMHKSKSETKTQWKNRLKAKAQQLFPREAKDVTLATADAFLIMEYGRRKHTGVL